MILSVNPQCVHTGSKGKKGSLLPNNCPPPRQVIHDSLFWHPRLNKNFFQKLSVSSQDIFIYPPACLWSSCLMSDLANSSQIYKSFSWSLHQRYKEKLDVVWKYQPQCQPTLPPTYLLTGDLKSTNNLIFFFFFKWVIIGCFQIIPKKIANKHKWHPQDKR